MYPTNVLVETGRTEYDDSHKTSWESSFCCSKAWRYYSDATHQLDESEVRSSTDMQKLQRIFWLSCTSCNWIGVQEIADIWTRNQLHDHQAVGARTWVGQVQVP